MQEKTFRIACNTMLACMHECMHARRDVTTSCMERYWRPEVVMQAVVTSINRTGVGAPLTGGPHLPANASQPNITQPAAKAGSSESVHASQPQAPGPSPEKGSGVDEADQEHGEKAPAGRKLSGERGKK